MHCHRNSKILRRMRMRPYFHPQLVDRYPTTVSDGHRTIIYAEDEELFARFLARVPAPTALQKLIAMPVGEVLALATAWVVILAVGSVIAAVGRAVWRFIMGN